MSLRRVNLFYCLKSRRVICYPGTLTVFCNKYLNNFVLTETGFFWWSSKHLLNVFYSVITMPHLLVDLDGTQEGWASDKQERRSVSGFDSVVSQVSCKQMWNLKEDYNSLIYSILHVQYQYFHSRENKVNIVDRSGLDWDQYLDRDTNSIHLY